MPVAEITYHTLMHFSTPTGGYLAEAAGLLGLQSSSHETQASLLLIRPCLYSMSTLSGMPLSVLHASGYEHQEKVSLRFMQ